MPATIETLYRLTLRFRDKEGVRDRVLEARVLEKIETKLEKLNPMDWKSFGGWGPHATITVTDKDLELIKGFEKWLLALIKRNQSLEVI